MLLKILTEIDAVSGNENALRDFLMSQLSNYADDIIRDSIGNLVFFKKGRNPTGKKIALFAHMDEIGMIVTDITDDGYIKFSEVGGIDDRIMLSQRVTIGDSKVSGVIGVKAVHLQSKSERNDVIKMDKMYIDIGATTREEAEKYVRKGDYIAFKSDFVKLYGKRFKAKAIDDRAGCAVLMELMKKIYDEDIYFCFTVQEETGLRGARVLTRRLNPDVALILESTTSSDTAFCDKHLHATTLGAGPVLSFMDRSAYFDRELTRFVASLADAKGIKYQYKLSSNGGNEAGAVQTSACGCRVCAISLPCRYIHSPVSVADMGDFEAMKSLVEEFLNNAHEFSNNTETEEC